MRLYKETDLAYIAGFMDGEGTLGIYNHGNKNRRCLQANSHLANTNYEVLSNIKNVLGMGRLFMGRKGTDKWKQLYRLEFSRKELKNLLPLLLPYLQIKKRQAILILEFLELLPRSQVDEKEKLAIEIKRLNKTGPIKLWTH